MAKKKIIRRRAVALSGVMTVLALLMGICYINHCLQLKKESAVYIPVGQQVKVGGHKLNIYTEGTGEHTLVFLSGGGTCSPVLDFRSLYSLLSGQYRIAVVEKAGYGFSEDSDVARDIDTVLSETREALTLAGLPGPYVLCPHSMSGIEALYWAQQYPEEVEAIIGLDMAVPASYKDMNINMSLMRLSAFAARLGLTRWIPGISEGDAIQHGTLTEEEKELYRAVFYRGTATRAMLNEAAAIKDSAALVGEGETVTPPILMFASDGSGGTGYDEETWRGFQYDFAAAQPSAEVVTLDCPHYVHDYEYQEIAARMTEFLAKLSQETE